MTTYKKPDATMREVLDEVLDEIHERLVDAGVCVYLLVAHGARDSEGALRSPAIKHHGVPALGLTRIVPLKQRVAGLGDAEVLIDGDRWEDLDDDERRALLDHELTHIEVLTNDDDEPVLDSAGRPKLRLRPHDHHFGWFDEVAKRHRGASQEVQQAQRFAGEAGQLYFAFAVEPKRPSKRAEKRPRSARPSEPAEEKEQLELAASRITTNDKAAFELIAGTVADLEDKVGRASLEVVRRAIELESRRKKPRNSAFALLENRLAALLDAAEPDGKGPPVTPAPPPKGRGFAFVLADGSEDA